MAERKAKASTAKKARRPAGQKVDRKDPPAKVNVVSEVPKPEDLAKAAQAKVREQEKERKAQERREQRERGKVAKEFREAHQDAMRTTLLTGMLRASEHGAFGVERTFDVSDRDLWEPQRVVADEIAAELRAGGYRVEVRQSSNGGGAAPDWRPPDKWWTTVGVSWEPKGDSDG